MPDRIFQTDIDTANQLITEWGLIAASIAQQCKWRPRGLCLANCKGLALCNLDYLILVDTQGQPVAQAPPLGQASLPAGLSQNPEPRTQNQEV